MILFLQPEPIESVSHLAHSLSSAKLASDAIIYLFWPSSNCTLLKEDVVFLDSPGVNVDPDLDAWIDRHCLDADVFILVANAESTLMQAVGCETYDASFIYAYPLPVSAYV